MDDDVHKIGEVEVCGDQVTYLNTPIACFREPGHFPGEAHRSVTGFSWVDQDHVIAPFQTQVADINRQFAKLGGTMDVSFSFITEDEFREAMGIEKRRRLRYILLTALFTVVALAGLLTGLVATFSDEHGSWVTFGFMCAMAFAVGCDLAYAAWRKR